MQLNQVTVPSLNIRKSVEFYETLGLELIVDTDHYARFVCPDGGSTFSVSLTEKIEQNQISVYFECTNLDQKVFELVAQGFIFDEHPTDQNYLWREARLRDPFGNKIVLYFAGENRINPPWRVQKEIR